MNLLGMAYAGNGIVIASYFDWSDGDNDYYKLIRSTDYGDSWSVISSSDTLEIYRVLNVYEGTMLYIGYPGTNFYSYRSDDYGATWTQDEILDDTYDYSYINGVVSLDNQITILFGGQVSTPASKSGWTIGTMPAPPTPPEPTPSSEVTRTFYFSCGIELGLVFDFNCSINTPIYNQFYINLNILEEVTTNILLVLNILNYNEFTKYFDFRDRILGPNSGVSLSEYIFDKTWLGE
jgi:hypothetical protein